MKLLRADVHSLTGAYAVDAIDDEAENDRFERHLRRCQQCTGEVRGFAETATRMAFAAAEPPPPAMREHVLAAISQVRQLPPVTEHGRPPVRAFWQGRLPMLSYAFAAACAAVAVVLLIALIGTRHQLDRAQQRDAALAAVLAAPDSRASTRTTSAGGHVTLVYSLSEHAVIFASNGLPAPPSGKVYELWLIGPPRVRPAGLLGSGAPGRSGPVLARGAVHGDDFGITIEPAGGTSKPTTNPLVVIPLRT
ncbi:MAG TPA: anti-sigma factor [Streptosporangiaceae bacterium]|nr:anti-sigma factor [Streptosporangiaceae bacterium]